MEFDPESIVPPGAKIKVVGVGGGGGNAVNTMIRTSLEGVEFVACNTDVQSLRFSLAPTKIQVGKDLTRGLGAGADPDVGREAALEDRHELQEHLEGADMVFITAGMGGGTGTGGAAVVAQIARELGALTVGVVTKPFTFEGKRRKKHAEAGIARLRECVDTLITIPNQRLLELATPDLSMIDAFKLADDVLVNAVKGISDIINIPGTVNVDFADVKTVMSCMGQALMGIGSGQGGNRATEAAQRAIRSPLLEDIDIEGATGVLVNITSGSNLSLMEVNEACSVVQEAAHEDANFIFGAVIDENLKDEIRVTVIATGFPIDSDETDAIDSLKHKAHVTSSGAPHNPFNTRLTEPPLTKRRPEMLTEPRHREPETLITTRREEPAPTRVEAPVMTPAPIVAEKPLSAESMTQPPMPKPAEVAPPVGSTPEPIMAAQPEPAPVPQPEPIVAAQQEPLQEEPEAQPEFEVAAPSEPAPQYETPVDSEERTFELSGGGDESEELARWTMGFTPILEADLDLEEPMIREEDLQFSSSEDTHDKEEFLPLADDAAASSQEDKIISSVPSSEHITGATFRDEPHDVIPPRPTADGLFDRDEARETADSEETHEHESAPLDALFAEPDMGSEIDRRIDEALEMAERLKSEATQDKSHEGDDLDVPAFLRKGMRDHSLD